MIQHSKWHQSALCVLLAVLLVQWTTISAQAEEQHFDLSSGSKSIPLAPGSQRSATIRVGDQARTISPGDSLTAAEYVAMMQILQTGAQRLNLDANGRAISGSFAVNRIPGEMMSGLTIPTGVAASHDFATTNAVLNLAGNLTNSGTLYAISTSSAVTTATIAAANIINNAGGVITTGLPAGGLPGVMSPVSGLNLRLVAANSIINAGIISSSRDLTAIAGNSIINSTAPGASAAAMQAAQNINLVTSNLVNSALISATTGHVNVLSHAASDLAINNTGGTIEAARNINVGDALDSINVSLKGGDWLSKELNVNAANKVNINVGELTGTVNVSASQLHVAAETDALRLGNICLKGDPTFYNQGDIILTSSMPLTTNGADLAIVARGNITTDPNGAVPITIDTSSTTNGGDITLIAGAEFTVSDSSSSSLPGGDSLNVISITGGTPDGGSIDLSLGAGISTLTSESLSTDQFAEYSGGNVLIAAFGSDTNLDAGKILLPATLTITTNGHGLGDGDVTMIAGNRDPGAVAIIIGSVDTGGYGYETPNPTGTGSIKLVTATPEIVGGPFMILDGTTIQGSITTAAFCDLCTPVLQPTSILAVSLTAGGTKDTLVRAGESVGLLSLNYQTDTDFDNDDIYGMEVLAHNAIVIDTINAIGPFSVALRTGDGGLTATGELAVGDLFIHTTGGVTGIGNIQLDTLSVSDLTIVYGGSLSAAEPLSAFGELRLTKTVGDIGSSSLPVPIINTGALFVKAPAGSAYITIIGGGSTQTVYGGAATNVGGYVSNAASAEFVVNALADDIVLNIAGLNLSFEDDQNNVVPQSTVKLSVHGDGNILSFSFLGTIHGSRIELSSESGIIGGNMPLDIAVPYEDVEPAGFRIGVGRNADTIVVASTQTGDIRLQRMAPEKMEGSSSFFPPSLGRIQSVSLGDNATFDFRSDGLNSVLIETNGITAGAGSSVVITSGGHIANSATIGTGVGSTISLLADFNIEIGADITTAGGGSINVEAGADIKNLGPGGRLGAGSVVMAAGGDIGTSLSRLRTFTENLSVTDANNAFINSEAFFPMNLGIVNAANLEFSTGGDVSTADVISGGSISITSDTGSISVLETLNPFTLVSLAAPNGSISNSSTINAINGDVFLLTDELFNIGQIQAGNSINLSSTPGNNLHLSGAGEFEAPNTTLVANGDLDDTNTIMFDSFTTMLFKGPVLMIANGDLQPTIKVGADSFISGSDTVTLFANGFTVSGTSELVGHPIRLITPNGTGVIANDFGNVVLNSSIVVSGHHLTILAAGSIVAGPGMGTINVSNFSGAGGHVTLVAGYDFTESSNSLFPPAKNLGILYTLTGPSQFGGSINMPLTSITTTSFTLNPQTALGGNVIAVAHAGTEAAGIISLGGINTTAPNGQAGKVTLIGQGGVKVGFAGINASGSRGGDIIIAGAEPTIMGGPISFQDGYQRSGGFFSALPAVPGAGGAIIVSGALNSNGTKAQAGDITIKSDSFIRTGGITAVGADHPFIIGTAGGTVNIESLGDLVKVTGSIDVSGLNNFSPTANAVVGADAGAILIKSPSHIEVTLNLTAKGGDYAAKGALEGFTHAGAGGLVFLVTDNDNINDYYTGIIKIGGVIDVAGGNATYLSPFPAQVANVGGAGGTAILTGGQVQVMGNVGYSIRATGGTSRQIPKYGTLGVVSINTYSVQAFPTNFDLSPTALSSEVVLPGGFFTVGTFNPENGTAGMILTTPSTLQGLKTGGFTDTVNGAEYSQFGISIDVVGGAQTIKVVQNGLLQDRTYLPAVAGTRSKVTPATAIALYQVSRGLPQTMGINNSNGAPSGKNPLIPGSGAGTSPAIITVNEIDIRQPFKTNFKIPVSSAGSQIEINVDGLRPLLDISTTINFIGQNIHFTSDNAIGTIALGSMQLNNQPASRIDTLPTGTLIVTSNGGIVNNGGQLKAGQIAFLSQGFSLTVDNKNNAISGVAFAPSPRVIIPAAGSLPVYSFKNAGGNFVIPIMVEYLPMPLAAGLAGERTMATTALRNVDITVTNNALGAGNVLVTGQQVVGGELIGNNVSVLSLPNFAAPTVVKPVTNLIIAAGTYVYASNNATIDSSGSLQLNSADLFSGSKPFNTLNVRATNQITAASTSMMSYGKVSIESRSAGFTQTGTSNNESWFDAFNITTAQAISLSANSFIGANKGISIVSRTSSATLRGQIFNYGGILNVTTASALTNDADLKSGTLAFGVIPTSTLTTTNIEKAGSITLTAGSRTVPSAITLLPNSSLVSAGGSITLTAYENINVGSPVEITANGGSVFLWAVGDVVGTPDAVNSMTTKITARAVGTTAFSTGGGVEILAGPSFPISFALAPLLFKTTPSAPSVATLGGAPLTLDNNGGTSGWVQIMGTGTVDLTTSGTLPTTLKLRGGAILFNSIGPNGDIRFDGVEIETAGFKPISFVHPTAPEFLFVPKHDDKGTAAQLADCYTQNLTTDLMGSASGNGPAAVRLNSGTAVLRMKRDTRFDTRFGPLIAKKGAMLAITSKSNSLRVTSLSGPGHVAILVGNSEIAISPSTELLITDGHPSVDDTSPSDGIGRRATHTQELREGLYATVSEVSIVSLIANHDCLSNIKRLNSRNGQALIERLLKTAAAVETITRTRGAYRAQPKQGTTQPESYGPTAMR